MIRRNAASAFKLAAATAVGQFVMPLIGWLATGSVHRYVEAFDHWIAFTVFLLLGLNVIIDARRGNKEEKAPCVLSLRLCSVSASQPALMRVVAGISLYFGECRYFDGGFDDRHRLFRFARWRVLCQSRFHRLPTCAWRLRRVVLILLGVKIL